MTVEQLIRDANLKPIALPSKDREVHGAYVGDLLSWVMGNANQGNVWITIMSNINTVAVATLVDVSCILLAEDVTPDDELIQTAIAKGVNILSTPLSAFEAAKKISTVIN